VSGRWREHPAHLNIALNAILGLSALSHILKSATAETRATTVAPAPARSLAAISGVIACGGHKGPTYPPHHSADASCLQPRPIKHAAVLGPVKAKP
jgi:hypothetical protein